MSASFVSGLRARPDTITLGPAGARDAITIRVEMPEVWDAVRIVVGSSEPVRAVKIAALDALFPEAVLPEDFVLKLGGWEILDESASLSAAGIGNDAILLITCRRRRPVK